MINHCKEGNNGRLQRLIFVLVSDQEKEDERAREDSRDQEVQRCCEEMSREGIAVLRTDCQGMDELERILEQEGWKAADCRKTLFLTDAGWIHKCLMEKGYYSIGYQHLGNAAERYEHAAFVVAQPEEVDADSYEKIWQRAAGLPWVIARTERLLLREMTMDDLDALYRLYDDEAARQYLDPLSEDRSKEAELLGAYIRRIYPFYGYGMWAVCSRSDGEMIGRAGLAPCRKGQDGAELGYLIRKDLRGQGLAAEAGRAVLEFARESLGMQQVVLYTMPSNEASKAVAETLGFQPVGSSEPPKGKETRLDESKENELEKNGQEITAAEERDRKTFESDKMSDKMQQKENELEEWRIEWHDQ